MTTALLTITLDIRVNNTWDTPCGFIIYRYSSIYTQLDSCRCIQNNDFFTVDDDATLLKGSWAMVRKEGVVFIGSYVHGKS